MTQTFPILVASDLSEASGYAFEQAAHLALSIPGGVIHLLHVMDAKAPEARVRQLAGQLHTYVSEKAQSMGGLNGLPVGVHVRHGDSVREIVQLATELDAKLIVLGTPKHPHLRSWILDSVSEKIVAHAPCPVILAGPKPVEPHVHHPAIEPACPDCIKVRTQSAGREWWCARHTSQPGSTGGHVYSYQRELPFAVHDSAVTPTGIRF